MNRRGKKRKFTSRIYTDFCAKNKTKTFLFDSFLFDRIEDKYLQNFPNLIVNDYLLSSLSHRCLKLFKRSQTV